MKLRFEPAKEEDIAAIFSFNKEQIDAYEDFQSIEYKKVLEWVHQKIETHINV